MTIYNSILATFLIGITIASCGTKGETTENKTADTSMLEKTHTKGEQHWSYTGETGPEHWAEIEKDSDCGGQYQSPINIVDATAVTDNSMEALDIHYDTQTKIHDVKNNGHSVQYNFEPGDYINYNGAKFDLKQIHFHESSEHTINGVRYPLVIHMVHTNPKGEYLVLAIMAEEGETSPPFEFLESYLPIHQGEIKPVDKTFDLNLNLPADKGYYNYVGSLTTPPCTEGVNWIVFKQPITISLDQVNNLKKEMPINNYRNEQPLNNRTIKKT